MIYRHITVYMVIHLPQEYPGFLTAHTPTYITAAVRANSFHFTVFNNEPEQIPVVTGMATAAAVRFSGRCDLAVRGGKGLHHACPLLSRGTSSTASRSSYSPTERRNQGVIVKEVMIKKNKKGIKTFLLPLRPLIHFVMYIILYMSNVGYMNYECVTAALVSILFMNVYFKFEVQENRLTPIMTNLAPPAALSSAGSGPPPWP